MKKLRMLLTVLTVFALSLALAACGGGNQAPTSVEGKTYESTDVTVAWTSTATQEQKAAIVAMVQLMLPDEADTVTEANVLEKLEATAEATILTERVTITFTAGGVAQMTVSENDAQTGAWTQDGDTVTLTQTTGNDSFSIKLKVSGSRLTASATEIAGQAGPGDMAAGVEINVIFTEKA